MNAPATATVHITAASPLAVVDGIAMCGSVRAVASAAAPRIQLVGAVGIDGVGLAGDLLTAMAWLNTQYDPEGDVDDVVAIDVEPTPPTSVDEERGLVRWDAGVTYASREAEITLDARMVRCGMSPAQAGDLIGAVVAAEHAVSDMRDTYLYGSYLDYD